MAFQLENISKSFGNVVALDDVSFTTSEGELFGLIGPDGAGKTTLFRIIVTLLLADRGRVTVGGLDAEKDFRKIRQIIGYMAGRFSLYQDLSVRENLEFYATVFGTTVSENYDFIRDIYTHIEPFEDRLAGRLSGGMKQKLALSCALIHRPQVLVLDEPTTGVDAVSRMEFWEMLEKIRAEGITILVSTPYMDEAALCDRVGLIQHGRLLAVSAPAELKLRDGTAVYRFRTSGKPYDYLGQIRGLDDPVDAWLFGDEIHVFSGEGTDPGSLEERIRSLGAPDLEWEQATPTVEDYFMQQLRENREGGTLGQF